MRVHQLTSLILSPFKDGASPSGLWHVISGAFTIAANKYVVGNSSEVIMLGDLRFARLKFHNADFGLSGSQNPTQLAADIEFGYKDPATGRKATFLLNEDQDLVKATATLTSDATDVSDADTVTIGSTVYRFKSTMAQAYDVQIGGTAAISLDNLKAAINATGTPGVEYFAGTIAHPTVTATTNTDTTQVIEAITGGTAGNAIVTTEVSTHLSWGGATMAGGIDEVAGQLQLITVDEAGNSNTQTVKWQDAWNNDADKFTGEILWWNDRILFNVNGVTLGTFKVELPKDPMHLYMKTFGADTLTLDEVLVDNAEQSSIIVA